MPGHTKIDNLLQSIKDSPISWAIGAIISFILIIFGIGYNSRITIADEKAANIATYTHQNESNEKSENKNPYASFSGEINVFPDSGGISVSIYNSGENPLYFTGSYPVIMKIVSTVGSGKIVNWNYPHKINTGETILVNGVFYGNGIEETGNLKLGCEFQKGILDSHGQLIPCNVYGDKIEDSFMIPNLKDKKILGIDASDGEDVIDFELFKRTLSENFLGTSSPGKFKGQGKITITRQCNRGKKIFLFYNEKIVGEDLKDFMKDELFKYYSRVGAVDTREDIKEFTFNEFRNPEYESCEAHILGLISDCTKTKDGDKKNICSDEQKNFKSALEKYKLDYKQHYYSINLVGEDTHFVFIIFAIK